MSKNLKAEWFRLTHSGIYFSMYIVCGLLIIVMPLAFNQKQMDMDLYQYVSSGVESQSLMFAMFIGIMTAVMIGSAYHNRSYYYEIMNGAGIHKIIGSRLLIYNGMAFVFVILPMGIIGGIIGMKNGVGEMKNIAVFVLLFLLISVHLVNHAVLFAMLVKNLIGGAFIPYVSVMVEQMSYMMFMETAPEKSEQIQNVFDWFSSVQFLRLAQPEYSAAFVTAVVVSLLAESLILYLAVYATYRRKMFK